MSMENYLKPEMEVVDISGENVICMSGTLPGYGDAEEI